MTIQYGEDVAAELLGEVPEFRSAYDEHVRAFDELLLHLLVADFSRFVTSAQLAGETDVVERVLAVAERLLIEGDESTNELIAVSFVEHLGAVTEPGERDVVLRFPPHLAAELQRQRDWRAG